MPWSEGFEERLVNMVKICLQKLTESEKLPFTELLTLLFETENVLINRLLCFIYHDNDDDVSHVLVPNCLLYRKSLDLENKIVKEIDFGVIHGSNFGERKCALQDFVKLFLSV